MSGSSDELNVQSLESIIRGFISVQERGFAEIERKLDTLEGRLDRLESRLELQDSKQKDDSQALQSTIHEISSILLTINEYMEEQKKIGRHSDRTEVDLTTRNLETIEDNIAMDQSKKKSNGVFNHIMKLLDIKTEIIFILALICDVWVSRKDAYTTAWSMLLDILFRGLNLINFAMLWYLPNASWKMKILSFFVASSIIEILKHIVVADAVSETIKDGSGYCLLVVLLLDTFGNYLHGSFSKVSLFGIGLRMILLFSLKDFCCKKVH
jgi:hypothetical protein